MSVNELLESSFSIERGFSRFFTETQKIVIYGAGNIGIRVYQLLKEEGYCKNIIAFLDIDEKKTEFDGIPILRPGEAESLEPHVLIVSICLPMSEYPVFYEEHKTENTVSIVNGFQIYIEDWFWSDPREAVFSDNETKERIRVAYGLLKDVESKQVFHQSLECHLKNRYENASWNTELEQYMIPELNDTKVLGGVADCGAYIGDTLDSLLKYKKINAYYGFEPDIHNFQKLAKKADTYESINQILLFPNAVGNRNDLLRFETGGTGTSSALDNNGNSYAMCVTLDAVLKKADIAFIKMDIEGAEMDALSGAADIIRKQKPDLAICVYHKMEHLWEIPVFLKGLVPEYSFYFRCHYGFTLETVLYATTKKR